MEVFTAVYDYALNEKIKPCSMIINKDSFRELIRENAVYFSGSGSKKLRDILQDDNVFYVDKEICPDTMAQLSYKNFIKENFADVTYSSPLYLKEFHTILPPEI